MSIKLVEITADDLGWKGTWYRKRQRHFVTEDPDYPSVMACRWRAIDACGGIRHGHAVELVGLRVWLRCKIKAISLHFRRGR